MYFILTPANTYMNWLTRGGCILEMYDILWMYVCIVLLIYLITLYSYILVADY